MYTTRKLITHLSVFSGMRNAVVRMLYCIVFFLASDLTAQCDFRDNGYFFLHPYFNKTNWQAAIYQAEFSPAEAMCTAKPQRIDVQQFPASAAMVYTVANGDWMLTTAPLVATTCVCCKPVSIEYVDPPGTIILPAGLQLRTTLPFHVLARGTADKDTVLLAAAGMGETVYCLHINVITGAVGAVDSFPINPTGQQAIGGVWGAPDTTGIDTALWIAGSRGLVRLFPFKNNKWGTAQSVSMDNAETVTAIGGGYAGTATGKIYRRAGASFTLENGAASSAIRKIDSRIAVGDSGAVLVRQSGGSWRLSTFGTANYRAGNITGTTQGTVVELVDENWKYTVQSLYDSSTRISSVHPSEVGAGLNSGVYGFTINGSQTITINLRDPDDNRAVPDIKIHKRSGGGTSLSPTSAVTSLLRHNPAAICTTTQAYFNDTLVKLVLSRSSISLEAKGTRGSYDASCDIWKWQICQYTAGTYWDPKDTIVATCGKDTLRIANVDSNATPLRYASQDMRNGGWCLIEGCVHLTPSTSVGIRSISVVDIAGRRIWRQQAAGNFSCGIVSPRLPAGVLFVVVESVSGATDVKRITVAGR